ncbi:MAG: DNA cytosine methyltransferase [Deltaproteobacteria bacterium]|jgi:DNA (cytosine-5)-methyltransferase 1|nr:DNA cytosine methyltransferase [Deltaproteobacteria bacterium]
MRAVSLFCGCGGMDLGLSRAGFDIVWAGDASRAAAAVYALNVGPVHVGDIRDADPAGLPEADLLAAGFPCQTFSEAGRREGDADPKGGLYREALRMTRALRPRCVLFENVRGILSTRMTDGRLASEAVREDLEAEGYAVHVAVLNAADFRVPQMRIRVFFFGFRDGMPERFPGMAFRPAPRDGLALGDILPLPPDAPDHEYPRLTPAEARIVPLLPEGGNWKDIPDAMLPPRYRRMKGNRLWEKSATIFRRRSRREIAGTIIAQPSPTRCSIVHPVEDRLFSIRECARIQGFPDSFRFPREAAGLRARYRMIGNAVPPPLAEHIGRVIAEALGRPVRERFPPPRGRASAPPLHGLIMGRARQ